jgi:hypothetical protein
MDIPAIFGAMPLGLRRHSLVKFLLAVFPDSHDQLIEFNSGARAYVDLRDAEVRNVFLKRSFEAEFFRIAESVLACGGVYFDCGANFGLCTFGLLEAVDHGNLQLPFVRGECAFDFLSRKIKETLPVCADKRGGRLPE